MRFKQGDVIKDSCSFRRILGVCGESYISTTGSSNLKDVIGSKIMAAVFSDYELRDYFLYTPPVESPVIEISKDEAFRILAKERGVDVSKVRIKD